MVGVAVDLQGRNTATATACDAGTPPTAAETPSTATPAEQQSRSATADERYTCSACASTWAYQTVRNTGRCPACGGGLRRTDDPAP